MSERTVAEIKHLMNPHLSTMHSVEVDETLNDLSRELIAAVKRENGQAWLGKINLYTEDSGHPVQWEWDGTLVYDFGAAYVLPAQNQEIAFLVQERDRAEYTGTAADRKRLDVIYDAIDAAGGHYLFWT